MPIVVLFLSWAFAGHAQELALNELDERKFDEGTTRLALIVWAENYGSRFSEVENARNDGSRIAQEFYKLKFNLVREVNAQTANDILKSINEIKSEIDASLRPTMVVFYFAGHGFQVDGDNFLVPELASNDSLPELINQSFSVTEIARKLTPRRDAGSLLLMLDACRTVRFLEDGSLKDFPMRDGLEPGFHNGSLLGKALVSTSSLPGNPARSASRFEDGHNSPYTRFLANNIGSPGKSLSDLLSDTESAVLQDTDGKQKPSADHRKWSSTFYFNPLEAQLLLDQAAWEKVRAQVNNLRGCAYDYLLTYPTGRFAIQAEYLLSRVSSLGEYCQIK